MDRVMAKCKGRLTINGNEMDVFYTKEMNVQDVKIDENFYEIPKVFCERHLNGKLTCNEHDKEFNQFIDHMPETRYVIEQLQLENASTTNKLIRKNTGTLISSRTSLPFLLLLMIFYAAIKFMIMSVYIYEDSRKHLRKNNKFKKE